MILELRRLLAAGLVGTLCGMATAAAVTTNFTGTQGVVWNNAANWSNGIPNSTTSFKIPSGAFLMFSVPVVISNYAATGLDGNIGLNTGEFGTLYIQTGGSLNLAGNLAIGSGASSGVELTGGAQLSGNTLSIFTNSQLWVSGAGSTAKFSTIDTLGGNNNVTIDAGSRVECDYFYGRGAIQVNGTAGSKGTLVSAFFDDVFPATLTLDGGVLEARNSTPFPLTAPKLVLGAAGGIIDTAGHSMRAKETISGAGQLTKTGAGTLTLSVVSSHTGGTAVSEGTLVLTSAAVAGTGTMQVGVNGVLAGNGTIRGDTVVEGHLSPGTSSIGQLSVTSLTSNPNLTFTDSAILDMEIASLASFDRLVVDGSVTYAGTLQIRLLNGYLPGSGDTFQLFNAGMGGSGGFGAISLSQSGYVGNFNSATGTLQITAVPEPSVAVLGALGCGLAARRRRRGGNG